VKFYFTKRSLQFSKFTHKSLGNSFSPSPLFFLSLYSASPECLFSPPAALLLGASPASLPLLLRAAPSWGERLAAQARREQAQARGWLAAQARERAWLQAAWELRLVRCEQRRCGKAGASAGPATGGGVAAQEDGVQDDSVQRMAVSPLGELRPRPGRCAGRSCAVREELQCGGCGRIRTGAAGPRVEDVGGR
jgi:hypothetical protein